MNDLRSPLEDRPYRVGATRSDERMIATSEYYRTRLGSFRQSRWFPLVSVLAAVLLFSVIISYAYKQGTQSGENATTPVIQASVEEIKQKPENPGGMEVPFQDAVVFDQIQKQPEGAAPTETVENLLATPEQPVVTPETKQEVAETAPVAVTSELPVAKEEKTKEVEVKVAETVQAPSQEELKTETIAPAPEAVPTTEPAPSQTAEISPPKEQNLQQVVAKAAETTAETSIETTTENTPSVPTPVAEDVQKIASVAPAAASPTAAIESGSYRIQLGAFRDEAAARLAWSKFQKEFGNALASITPDFQRADLGAKGIFYRVQGTNLSKTSADTVCRELNTIRSSSCMVVK